MSIERTVAGTVATVFTISMKLPQIYHSLKTKRTKDISMLFLLLHFKSYKLGFICYF